MNDKLPDEKSIEAKGFEYWEKGDYQKAVTVFKEGLWKFPGAAALHTGLGYSYFHLSENLSAVEAFENARNIALEDPQVLRGLGLAYLKLNWLDKASDVLADAAGHFRDNAFILMEMAYSFLQANAYSEALSYSEKALAIDSDYVSALICKGACYHFLELDEDVKIECFRKALDIEPDRPDLLDFYANVLYDDCKFEEALAYFEKMPLKDIVNPVTLQRLVELYKFFEVDEEMVARYRARLDDIERENSVDGFIDAMMQEWAREEASENRRS